MTVTKKQTSIAVFAVIFATAMIAGTLASATVDARQSISQHNHSDQSSKCVASGGVSVANGGCLRIIIWWIRWITLEIHVTTIAPKPMQILAITLNK